MSRLWQASVGTTIATSECERRLTWRSGILPGPMDAPYSQLERSLIEGFVRGRGYAPDNLAALDEAGRHALLKEASVYASSKLSEVESRARFVHEIHDGGMHD